MHSPNQAYFSGDKKPQVLFTAIPFIGHLNPLLLQGRELSRRGYHVSVAAFDSMQEYVVTHFPEISFVSLGEAPFSNDQLEGFLQLVTAQSSWLKNLQIFAKASEKFWTGMFDGLLIEVRKNRPDLLIVDYAATAGLDVAEKENIPFVVNNADLLAVLPLSLFPHVPGIPRILSGKSIHDIGPLQKFFSKLDRNIALTLARILLERKANALRKSRGLPPIDQMMRLQNETVLVNGAFGLEYERPLPPAIHMVGPMSSAEKQSLPAEWDTWLTEGKPVVYVSFGTLSAPTNEHLKRITEGLCSDDFRALWVMRKAAQTRLPEPLPANIRVESWVPSPMAILQHPNVKAFVSHCGVNSVQESIQSGTPVVGIPMFAAQRDMGLRVQDAGVGILLDKTKFQPAELKKAVSKVMTETSYRHHVARIKASFEKAGGVNRAADLIEKKYEAQQQGFAAMLR